MLTIATGKKLGVAASISAGLSAGAAFVMSVDHQTLFRFISAALQNQIAQAGVAFSIAAWLHSGRVKKEIALNFKALTEAIDRVAKSLRQDLDSHGERLDNLTGRVDHLEKKTVKPGE